MFRCTLRASLEEARGAHMTEMFSFPRTYRPVIIVDFTDLRHVTDAKPDSYGLSFASRYKCAVFMVSIQSRREGGRNTDRVAGFETRGQGLPVCDALKEG